MSKKLWGSRFSGELSELSKKFTYSIDYDSKLALYDCMGSCAHAEMLGAQAIISKKDATTLVKGLKAIAKQITDGTYKYDPTSEDIHTDIQIKLKKLIGAPADKLHTARSRNDQVVLDMKMYCLDHIQQIIDLISGLQKSIVQLASKHTDTVMPAYTHLQSAQLVTMGHHLLAYVEMLQRDKSRFDDAFKRTNINPLGACALSGTTLPTDRTYVTKKLGFNETSQNSMDSVADRDFIIELVSHIAITGMHLSRMCEDLILWVTMEFDFVCIDDEFCTGSSIMPHKKNPDVCELVRGTASKFPGRLAELLVLTKALPLTYNRDLQMDKPALFDCVETIEDMLALMAELFKGVTVNKKSLAKAVDSEYFYSVDILDYLVKKGVSYREAHDTVGVMAKECMDQGIKISSLSAKELKKYSKYFEEDVKELLKPDVSVNNKKSIGGTAPALVKKQVEKWKKKLK